MARLELNPVKTMLKSSALQVPGKFSCNICRQCRAVTGYFDLELGPALPNDLVE